MDKFLGVAYWTLATNHPDWMARALPALDPLIDQGLIETTYEPLPDRDELNITINGEKHGFIKIGGRGRGVVRPGSTAGAMIVCLLAMQRAAGDLSIVDDLQKQISGVRQGMDFLSGSNWLLTQQFAEVVELLPSQAFKAKHAKVLGRMF